MHEPDVLPRNEKKLKGNKGKEAKREKKKRDQNKGEEKAGISDQIGVPIITVLSGDRLTATSPGRSPKITIRKKEKKEKKHPRQ